MVANSDYAFVSPFFLVSTKNFFPDFFLSVQVVRTDDLHLLQFFTKPALKEHIDICLLFILFWKGSIIRGLAQRIRETLHLKVDSRTYKRMG